MIEAIIISIIIISLTIYIMMLYKQSEERGQTIHKLETQIKNSKQKPKIEKLSSEQDTINMYKENEAYLLEELNKYRINVWELKRRDHEKICALNNYWKIHWFKYKGRRNQSLLKVDKYL